MDLIFIMAPIQFEVGFSVAQIFAILLFIEPVRNFGFGNKLEL